uniref:Uncharacterized protein n=1 Tax=Oryza punctata TaxID=4537 RepID=A0A0E0KKH4_ORYPU
MNTASINLLGKISCKVPFPEEFSVQDYTISLAIKLIHQVGLRVGSDRDYYHIEDGRTTLSKGTLRFRSMNMAMLEWKNEILQVVPIFTLLEQIRIILVDSTSTINLRDTESRKYIVHIH